MRSETERFKKEVWKESEMMRDSVKDGQTEPLTVPCPLAAPGIKEE